MNNTLLLKPVSAVPEKGTNVFLLDREGDLHLSSVMTYDNATFFFAGFNADSMKGYYFEEEIRNAFQLGAFQTKFTCPKHGQFRGIQPKCLSCEVEHGN